MRWAPRRLREATRVDAAVGLLMAIRGIAEDAARVALTEAAARAGVGVPDLAQELLKLNRGLPPQA
jgi:AmiR/NasT family two-component response regulator